VTAPLLVRALRGEPVERIPAWVMRQAGRTLPEYRALKENHGFLGMVTDPVIAAEVTLQPLARFKDLDAAILFSDIMTPFLETGIGLRFDPGPVLERPIRTRAQVEAMGPYDPDCDAPYLAPAVRLVKKSLPPGAALLGFAGSPFTVASYLVEGGGSGGEARAVRRFAEEDRDTVHLLLRRLAEATVLHLRQQILAGADAVQVFDTWGQALSRREYQEMDEPYLRLVFEGIADLGAPAILYCGGAFHQFADAAATGASALSVDHRVPLDEVRKQAGPRVALQGNLDPAVLFGPRERIVEETERVLMQGGPRGFVFNLGHGIWPETPLEAVRTMLETVRSIGGRICAKAAGEGGA